MEPIKDKPTQEADTSEDRADAIPSEASSDKTLTLSNRVRRGFVVTLMVLLLLSVGLAATGNVQLLAQSFFRLFPEKDPQIMVSEVNDPAADLRAGSGFTYEDSELHPDQVFRPYMGQPLTSLASSAGSSRLIPQFRDLLNLYVQRQAEDDNFTVRVVDNRTDEVLSLYTLDDARARYERTGSADWGAVDRMRREATTRLLKKFRAQGIPNDALTVKWGRANQVLEARKRDAPYIEYEVKLARYFGLSLLVTEIGTVETFNQDRLVSAVGARSRYQMMPYILRRNDIHHYKLQTAYGKQVPVFEEWHPLLTMEPAFKLVRGYVNAVGHEIPGISAYHTGPGNIFKIFRMYLTDDSRIFTPTSSVMDAYMWAVTEGYDKVSSQTSFRGYSRGYVASGYGSLRAVEDIPVDPARTFRGERVQMKPGEEMYLSDLLRAIEDSGIDFDWGPLSSDLTPYQRFRTMNPHFQLPETDEDGVPPEGDVRLVARSDDADVRFFLPLHATDVLEEDGIDVFDDDATFRFDEDTYAEPGPSELTMWDYQYRDLLDDIETFGFTLENRDRLRELADRFKEMAKVNPTHFRLLQRDIITQHLRLWSFDGWEALAGATRAAKGSLQVPVRPPTFEPLRDLTAGPQAQR